MYCLLLVVLSLTGCKVNNNNDPTENTYLKLYKVPDTDIYCVVSYNWNGVSCDFRGFNPTEEKSS